MDEEGRGANEESMGRTNGYERRSEQTGEGCRKAALSEREAVPLPRKHTYFGHLGGLLLLETTTVPGSQRWGQLVKCPAKASLVLSWVVPRTQWLPEGTHANSGQFSQGTILNRVSRAWPCKLRDGSA